jgi:hypothetical protein
VILDQIKIIAKKTILRSDQDHLFLKSDLDLRSFKKIITFDIFVREHGVHAGPKDYCVVVVVVVIRGSI